MTKIKEKTSNEDMQTHIQNAFELINEHLPENYVHQVQEILGPESDVTVGMIRNLRSRSYGKITDSKLPILSALVEVAKKNRDVKEKFISSLQ